MRRVMLSALLALALPTFALAGSITIDFGIAPHGGHPTFMGPTDNIADATSLDLGSEPYIVNEVQPDDQSGVTEFGVSQVHLSGVIFNLSHVADGGTGTTDLVKSWVAKSGPFAGDTFTETFDSFSLGRNAHQRSLSLLLQGTLSVSHTSVLDAPVTATITASNVGLANSHTVNWSMTEASTATVIPEPGTLGMLGTGLVGLAGLARRKLKL